MAKMLKLLSKDEPFCYCILAHHCLNYTELCYPKLSAVQCQKVSCKYGAYITEFISRLNLSKSCQATGLFPTHTALTRMENISTDQLMVQPWVYCYHSWGLLSKVEIPKLL